MKLMFLAAALALALPATADHCTIWSTALAEVDTNGFGITPRHYVDSSYCYFCFFPSVWIYEESNGIDGLQRGDEIIDNTCHGMIQPDTIVL